MFRNHHDRCQGDILVGEQGHGTALDAVHASDQPPDLLPAPYRSRQTRVRFRDGLDHGRGLRGVGEGDQVRRGDGPNLCLHPIRHGYWRSGRPFFERDYRRKPPERPAQNRRGFSRRVIRRPENHPD